MVATRPTIREILPPYIVLTNRSLPRSSVPKIWPSNKVGGAAILYQSVSSIAYGLKKGPINTMNTINTMVAAEMSAALFLESAAHASFNSELVFFICFV